MEVVVLCQEIVEVHGEKGQRISRTSQFRIIVLPSLASSSLPLLCGLFIVARYLTMSELVVVVLMVDLFKDQITLHATAHKYTHIRHRFAHTTRE